jgi:hypothetical protein
MRRFALLPLFLFALACSDDTPMQPEDGAGLTVLANTAGNPHNPFVGSWWGLDRYDDNSLHHVKISHPNAAGFMQVHLRDDAMSVCGGAPGILHTTGRIVAENALQFTEVQTICKGNNPLPPFTLFPLGYQYVPADDQLLYCVVLDDGTFPLCGIYLTRAKADQY